VAGEQRTRVVGTTVGRRNRPHLLEAWGERFNLQLDEHVALFRYRDMPGMIGRVGTEFGEHGINIVSAAVGQLPDDEDGGGGEKLAVMVVTADRAVPPELVEAIAGGDGFTDGRAVDL
jgi:D-3-phosphoglycerate dehydrogenase